MKDKIIFDVEVYPNCFLCSIKDYKTKKITVWEISSRKNDFKKIKSFFSLFKGFLIGFNSIHYDNCIILWLIDQSDYNPIILLPKLKSWSDKLIKEDFWWSDKTLQKYKYHNLWIDIDLYLYWSKQLRLSKKISLKSLGIQLNYPVVQELPFDPDTFLTDEEIDKLIEYNSIHDLGITELLTQQFEGKGSSPLGNLGTIQLRSKVFQKYKINAFSWDAPKIASEVIIYETCKKTWNERDDMIYGTLKNKIKDFKKMKFQKDSFYFKELFNESDFDFKTILFQNLFKEWMNSFNVFNKEFVAFSKNKEYSIKLSVGMGGIHNLLKNKVYESDDEYDIVDIDIESLYPTFILGLHCFRFETLEETYSDFKHLRVTESKPNVKKFKGTNKEQFWKDEDSFYKVILNGLSGHLDQEHSPLYNNKGAMKMRCMGQLVLLYITEIILEENVEIIQINTKRLVF